MAFGRELVWPGDQHPWKIPQEAVGPMPLEARASASAPLNAALAGEMCAAEAIRVAADGRAASAGASGARPSRRGETAQRGESAHRDGGAPPSASSGSACGPRAASDPAPRRDQNTRRESRIPFARMITLHVLTDDGLDQPTDGHLADISSRGIGVRVAHRLAPGQRFSLNLATQMGPCAYFYEVTYASQTPEKIWHIGAKSIGLLGRHGTERPEKIILALMTGTMDKKSA